jgi:hypothetical protein
MLAQLVSGGMDLFGAQIRGDLWLTSAPRHRRRIRLCRERAAAPYRGRLVRALRSRDGRTQSVGCPGLHH